MNDYNKVKNANRIVFKLGTNVLRNDDKNISLGRIYSFVEDIVKLHAKGKEILIVTSGAVSLGAKKLNIDTSTDIELKQACAAVGQGQLISIYEDAFSNYGITTAQILLTEEDFSERKRYLSLSTTLNQLLEHKVIPIINQNDTVSTDELEALQDAVQISFSDNDKLSALVTSGLDADLLVILSDIEGLYNDNPKTNPDAKIIPFVEDVNESIEQYAQGASQGGRGGMKTKLEAAKIVTKAGAIAIIACGKTPQIIKKIFENHTGTIFYPQKILAGKKRWIAYATHIVGQIVVNDGAKKSIIEKNTSLLPIGIVQVLNDFKRGDVISVLDQDGKEFARGVVNYNCKDCKKIMGEHSDKIIEILGYKNYDTIISKDNIVLC